MAVSANATGTITLDRVAPYPDLVRMDGPGQYSIPASTKKRYSLLWGGSTRKTTWLKPKFNSSDRKDVRWSYLKAGEQVVVNNCEKRAGEDCAFALPAAGDVTKVLAEARVSTDPDKWALIAEITPVKGVPAPATTAFEAVRYVPVALEFAGVPPAFFETELTLVNGTAGTVEAELKWGGLTQNEIVGAGRQFVINGLIEALRETNPSQAGAVGPLKVTFRGLASESDKRLVGVAARTTTPAGAQSIYRMSGRAGLAYRGVSRDELLGGEAGQAKVAWLIGLRGTTQSTAASVDRSNMAVAKPDPNDPDAVVSIEFYGRTGTLLTTLADQTIKSWTQWSILAPTYANGTEVAYAKVVWKSGGPVTAYATPVNNMSGDGSWVFPVKEEPAGAATTDSLVFPVLFEFPSWGAGNSRFLADAALAVPGTQTLTKLDYFWQAGAAKGTTSLTNNVKGQTILGSSIDPGVKSLGVVQSLRAGTGSVIPPQAPEQLVIGAGLLSRADNQPFIPGTLMAGARVDGPSSEQDATAALYGRFGIYLPAVPMRDLKNLAELRILGLRQDAWVRSNLALINPGNDPVTLKLDLQVTKADGSAALVLPTVDCGTSKVQNGLVTLPERFFCQIGSVLGEVGATSGYAILSRAGADAATVAKPFLAYGVVNDGPDASRGTSDGAYLLAELTACSSLGIKPTAVGASATALPGGTKNSPYKVELTATPAGRTYSFTATGLPAGLAVTKEGDKWYLSGTPTANGDSTVKITAKDEAGCSSAEVTYTLSISDCAFELVPPTLTTGKAANSSTFQVRTACSWTPRSAAANADWLTVNNPVKQTGTGTVSYSWTQNDGADREGKVEIVPDGATTAATSFILKQTVGCAYDLVVEPKTFCKAGGSGTVTVTPSAEACLWSLTGPSWVSVPTESNTGTKTVNFTVTELTTFTQRDGDIRITDAPYATSISQANPGPLSPTSNGPICAGNTLQLNVTGGLEGATYAWTGPNNFTSTQQNPSIPNATVTASGNYTVKQTADGCDSATATLAVVVNPNPEITAFTAVPPSITKGQESTLTATFTDGTGVITPGNIAVTSGTGVKVSPTSPTTYTLTVTSNTTPSCGTKTATVAVAVDCPAMTVTPASLSNGTAGVAYGPVTFGNTGGFGTVTYTVSFGALPTGMNLATTGVLSGTPTTAGPFNFTVTATDSNGCPGTRAYSLVIDKGTATVTITSDTPDPSAVGQAVAVAFTVTGSGAAPTGNVTVSAPNTTGDCTATVAAGTCNLTFTTAGSKTITATYAGDTNYNSGASDAEPHTVDKGTATVTITSDTPDPSAVGQAVAVAFTVTGSGAAPTGNVTVSAPNTTGDCTATVAAGTCNLTFTTAGSKTITATYAGDTNYNSGASDTEPHTVNKGTATVTITSDTPDPSAFGQAVAVAFTVTGSGATPTGNVTVSAPNTTGDCTTTVATGTCNLTFTTAGSKTITATYVGDANYNSGASDTESHTVNKGTATVTITSDTVDPSALGQAVAVAITVTGSGATPTGDVTVSAPNTTGDCTTTVATGTCNLTFTTAGSKTITATYAGDVNYDGGASDTEPHTVSKGAATVTITSDTPDPSAVGQAVAVAFTVTGSGATPTGNVTVSAPNTTGDCTATVATGTCNLTFTTAGSKTITATYAGDTNYDSGASDTEGHTVNKGTATVTITSDTLDPSALGQAVEVAFTVTGSGATPTGNVTVSAPNTTGDCTTTVSTGTCNLTFTTAGSKTITATYAGDANYDSGASDTEPHTVNKGTATVTITSDTPDPSATNQGVTVVFTVTGSGATPTGNVTVSAPNTTGDCTATVATGTCSLTFTTPGSKTITATYAGDANYDSGASDTEPHTVDATLTLTAAGNGSERVSSSPAGISNCANETCAAPFAVNTPIVLSATSATVNWTTGVCSEANPSQTCTLTISTDLSVKATF